MPTVNPEQATLIAAQDLVDTLKHSKLFKELNLTPSHWQSLTTLANIFTEATTQKKVQNHNTPPRVETQKIAPRVYNTKQPTDSNNTTVSENINSKVYINQKVTRSNTPITENMDTIIEEILDQQQRNVEPLNTNKINQDDNPTTLRH